MRLPSLTRKCIFFTLNLFLLVRCAHAYSTGAPGEVCTSMVPRHGTATNSRQTSPFVVIVSKDSFGPNEEIMVMLRGLCGNEFKGFLVEARRADPRFNQTERLGTFTSVDGARYACERESGLTHISNSQKRSLLFSWTAPPFPIGNIIITATIVQRFSVFWVGVNSAVLNDTSVSMPLSINKEQLKTPYITPCPEDLPSNTTTSSPTTTTQVTTQTTTQPVTTKSPTTPRDVLLPTVKPTAAVVPPTTRPTVTIKKATVVDDRSKCGKTRGCFSICEGDDCSFSVQWSDMGDRVWFSLSAKVLPGYDDQWLAIGLSYDKKMGDDSVMECMSQGGRRSISLSYNLHRKNRRIQVNTPVVFPRSDTLTDGYLTCEFVRLKKIKNNDKLYDLDKDWYLFVAQGPILDGRMERHAYIPWVSRFKVDMQSQRIEQVAFGDRILIKVHACTMVFAWMFLASIGIVIARFYKPIWPQKRVCGRKIWFTVHRLLMIILALLVIGSFVIIFYEVEGLSDVSFLEFRKFHPILGIIVTALTIIQVFMGFFRPTSSSKNRPVFNWAHWCVGIIDHILAVFNIILGVGLTKSGLPEYISYIIYCFSVYQVFIVLVLEVVNCNSKIKERKQQSYSIYANRTLKYSSTKDTTPENDTEPPGSPVRKVILHVHILVITAFSGGVVAIIAVS